MKGPLSRGLAGGNSALVGSLIQAAAVMLLFACETLEHATVFVRLAGGFHQASGESSPRSTFYPCRPLSASHPMLCSPKAISEALA